MASFRLRSSLPHWLALVVWLVLGFTVSAWILRAQGATSIAPTPRTENAVRQDPDGTAVAKALGATPVTLDKAAPGNATLDKGRFVLAGVVAQGQGRGAALIGVDGKPAKPVAVGASVIDGWVLSKVERDAAWIGPEKGAGDAVQLLLVPVDSKKPLAVNGVAPAPTANPEPSKPALAPLSPTLNGVSPVTKPAFGGAMMESVRNAAAQAQTQAEAAAANKGN